MNLEYERGDTRVGQTGFVAWIDNTTRRIHVKSGKCVRYDGYRCVIRTDDGEHELAVPKGRLEWSALAALEQLAIDVRAESEERMKPIQAKLNDIGRELLLDLVAIEMAKTGVDPERRAKVLEERAQLKRLEH
jgi:hypothetical protein